MIAPGALAGRLVLEAPIDVADGAGGVVRSYSDAAIVWAEVVPISAQARVLAERAGAVVTHRIRIRARDDITTTHRLRAGARRFRIVSVRDDDPSGRFLRIEAEEWRD